MKKIPVDGSSGTASINNAFEALKIENLPQNFAVPEKKNSKNAKPEKTEKLGKISLAIEKSGRSGKTVTVIFGRGIAELGNARRAELLLSLKKKFACGGALEDEKIELQGELRERAKIFLQMLGFSI